MKDYLVVYESGEHSRCEPGEEPVLRAAMARFLATGRDELVDLTAMNGDTYAVRVSNVTGWNVSTEEGRRRARELDAELKAEAPSWAVDD